MKVSELIEKLEKLPPDATVFVDRGMAYNDCKSVVHTKTERGEDWVFISDEEVE